MRRAFKKAAERVGIEATELGGHSLRSGLATTAARNGASERSPLFRDNAAAVVGL
jgi:hypothetical protein